MAAPGSGTFWQATTEVTVFKVALYGIEFSPTVFSLLSKAPWRMAAKPTSFGESASKISRPPPLCNPLSPPMHVERCARAQTFDGEKTT